MSTEFPSTQDVLGELIAVKSFTQQGQVNMVNVIKQMNDRWIHGDLKIHEFPTGASFADQDPRPRNITIDFGDGEEELVIFHGHFDTVPPPEEYKGFKRNPHELIVDERNSDIVYGLGAYDMLGGVTAYLKAARELQVATHRKIRILLVWGEENQSEGTHAALHPDNDLLDGASCVVSTEIPVKGQLEDPPAIYIGRQGRVGLDVTIEGPSTHSGGVTHEMLDGLSWTRDAKAKLALNGFRFSEHPYDAKLGKPILVPGRWGSINPQALSVVTEGRFQINAFYTDPELTKTEIQHMVREAIRSALGDDNFTVKFEKRHSEIPFTKPWLETEDSPFVRNAHMLAGEVYNQPVAIKAAKPVADEAIIAHAKHIPAIVFPPLGTGEHTRNECVSVGSIDYRVIPFLKKIASFPGKLTE